MFQFNLSRFVHFLRNSRSKVDSHSELQKGFAVFRQIPANPVVHLSLWAQRKSLYYLGQTVAFIFIFCCSMSATCCQAPLCLEKKIKAPNASFFCNHWRCIYNFWLFKINLAVWIICYDSSREHKDIVAIFSWARCVSFKDETDKNQ